MKRISIIISFCLCFLSLFFLDSVKAEAGYIVIDAGHGGRDSGAVVNGIKEDEINLLVAKFLEEIFMENNYKVIMTRTNNNDLCENDFIKKEDMNKRVKIINNSSALCCISIHMNKFSNSKYSGAQTFYSNNTLQSKVLALCIQNNLKFLLKNTDREIVFRDNIFLLNKVSIPITIVECGFLSNDKERNNLINSDYQYLLAMAIYYGVINFIQKIR